VDAGDGEATRELDLKDSLNKGVNFIEEAVNIDVDEQIRRLDGVPSRPGIGEVIGSGD